MRRCVPQLTWQAPQPPSLPAGAPPCHPPHPPQVPQPATCRPLCRCLDPLAAPCQQVLKTTQSGYAGFLHDSFTTLPDTDDRIVATNITAQWRWVGGRGATCSSLASERSSCPWQGAVDCIAWLPRTAPHIARCALLLFPGTPAPLPAMIGPLPPCARPCWMPSMGPPRAVCSAPRCSSHSTRWRAPPSSGGRQLSEGFELHGPASGCQHVCIAFGVLCERGGGAIAGGCCCWGLLAGGLCTIGSRLAHLSCRVQSLRASHSPLPTPPHPYPLG